MIKRIRKKQKHPEFIDAQILLAVRHLNKCTRIDLLQYCIINFNKFRWDYNIVRNSTDRLVAEEKIFKISKITDVNYMMKGKEVSRPTKIVYFYKNSEELLNDES